MGRCSIRTAAPTLALWIWVSCASVPLPAGCDFIAPPGLDASSVEREEIRFYLAKLKDPSCVQRVPHDDFHDVFYTGAERLAEIGEAAIPGLIEKLDSRDPYELSVALYALSLASQSVTAKTDGNYVDLGVALSPEYNAENRAIALAWWKQYGARIGRKLER